ncbi:MAG TPA: ATP-binding SpoIIE family protein phosphatase [Hyphomicrobiaceae bacterium]|nr:ATP-binding SpoIIE family protein phosphatase [Hyphomicrobiaceae bacterium]
MFLRIAERSRVAEARRLAVQLSTAQGFSEKDAGRVAIVATELATNLVKHAGGGEIVISSFDDAEGKGVELLALDTGPGIVDLNKALADGHSTSGTAGTGLGAIRRSADVFAVSSRLGRGTAVVARLKPEAQAPAEGGYLVAGLCAPYPGESVCGDGWATDASAVTIDVLMVDGSGHGPEAHKAALRAIDIFRGQRGRGVEQVAQAINQALTATRGAAVAVAKIDPPAGQVNFVGIGNIAAAVIEQGSVRRMVSNNGTAGHIAPRIRAFQYPVRGETTVILHSDGLTPRWDLNDYPGLIAAHPSLLAGILYRDFRRGRDDASIVVVRSNFECPPAS